MSDPARPDPFESLNPQQRSAVEHGLVDGALSGIPGPMLVIAGAGSGKTLTLAARVARLVLAGADPQRILLLTFSRRAAQEMQRRVGRVLHAALGFASNQRAPQLSWAGTFHGIGARLLREYAAQIGLAENFTIQDRGDSEDLMGLVRHELGLADSRSRFPLKGTCLAIYSRTLNCQQPLAEVLHTVYPWCEAWEDELRQLFRAYVAEKQRQCVLDYDDLLLHWSQLLDEPALARHLSARFEHVLVDEYQDTNRLQASILQALKPDGRGLTVVGDDAQAIYSFRAAEVRNILEFPARFEPPARTVTLARNYRSTQPILEASNQVIALAPQRFDKQLWSDTASSQRPTLTTVADESAQAAWVAERVLRHREHGVALRSQAVLFRTAHHSAALELELARRNIPFVKFGGLKFLEAVHVKDLLSVLRWVENPRHRLAGLRVAQLVPGLGTASAKRLLDAMGGAADPAQALHAFRPPPAAAADWAAWLEAFDALRDEGARWPTDLDRAIDWYRPHLRRLHDDASVREGDLAQLGRLGAGHASRAAFLADLTLDPPEATSDESGPPLRDEDYLILSTIHSAKGQEWKAVYVLNVVDGCIPSDMATGNTTEIEEERRLLYVAMTRARQHLHLLVPQRFYVTQQTGLGDRHLYGSLTRFIPPALAPCFDLTTDAATDDAPALARPAVTIDVASRARSMWS
jgi:DNA helicase-2/ATP-dependent DNA helicase PcrA